MERSKELAKSKVVGDPFDNSTDQGPQVNDYILGSLRSIYKQTTTVKNIKVTKLLHHAKLHFNIQQYMTKKHDLITKSKISFSSFVRCRKPEFIKPSETHFRNTFGVFRLQTAERIGLLNLLTDIKK